MKITNYHRFIVLLIVLIHSVPTFAQLGEVEGDFRVSDIRPTIELFDNDSAYNRVEGMIKNLGDDVYINSFAGNLYLGSRDDGQATLVDDIIITSDQFGGRIGVNVSEPKNPLHVKSSSTSSRAVSLNGFGMNFHYQDRTRGYVFKDNDGPIFITNLDTPITNHYTTFGISTRNINGELKIPFLISGDHNVGIGYIPSWPRANIHLGHRLSTNDPREDGVKIQNAGPNDNYFTIYVVNVTGDMELYSNSSTSAIGRFDAISGAYSALSDASVKENIQPIHDALNKISSLNPVSYHFRHDSIQEKKSFGLLAQELKEVLPELVEKSEKVNVNLVDYTSLIPWVIKAIQEQNEQLSNQEIKISNLDNRISSQNDELESNRQVIDSQSEYIKMLETKIDMLSIDKNNNN